MYDWAGDVRTVSIRKSRDGWFAPLDRIEDAMDAVATYLRDTDNLRTLDPSDVPGALASVYDVVNQTHPFREGNGRVQREFVTALARESGHRLDWTRVTLGRPGYESENDQASRLARTGDRGPLRAMFRAHHHQGRRDRRPRERRPAPGRRLPTSVHRPAARQRVGRRARQPSRTGRTRQGLRQMSPRRGLAVLAAAAVVAACSSPRPEVTVEVGGEAFAVELADTASEQKEGLAGREEIPAGTGMLFQFGERAEHQMWMAGMQVPIDVAWIDGDRVIGVVTLDPCTEVDQTTCPR